MKKELKDKMLEAIFVQTGGRPENPAIAEICSEIAVNHFSSGTKDESGISIEKTISIEIEPPAGSSVKRILLQWHSSAGGWMFQFWTGGGFIGDLIYACTKNMVFPSPFVFMEAQGFIPEEEYFHDSESEMVKMVSGLTQADFDGMVAKCRRAIAKRKENPIFATMRLPYSILLDLFVEKEGVK
jgi:hypothetical protein